MASQRGAKWPELLLFQAGVVSRGQTLGYGFSASSIKRRARSGAWQRMHRGTYATFSGEPARKARLWAAVLRAGPGAVLSHETAAEVHGLIDKPRGKIHISVPSSRDPARRNAIRGVVIHRSRNLVRQPLPPWELPRTPIAETVLDLAASAKTIDDAYGWLSQAIGSGLATRAMLRNALAARKRIRWRARIAEALTETAEGIMSPLERRYVRDVERAHGLPTASRQFRVVDQGTGQVRYLDNYYEAFRLCVELDGLASHPPEQKWRDADRDSDNLFRDDIQTVRLGFPHVTSRRCEQAAKLAALFIRRGWNGTGLRACGRPDCAVHRVLDGIRSGDGTGTIGGSQMIVRRSGRKAARTAHKDGAGVPGRLGGGVTRRG